MSASAFTPEARGALLERTAAGVSLPDACRASGVRLNTVKSWITRGRRDQAGPYTEWVTDLDAARERAAARPDPLTDAELRRHVSDMVRAGSVAAAKLYWQILSADQVEEVTARDDDPLAELDELARARTQR